MSNYRVVLPNQYTQDHKNYLNSIQESVLIFGKHTDLLMIFKDCESRIISASDASAHTLGLRSGQHLQDMFLEDVPCKSIAENADQIKQQEINLLEKADIQTVTESINIFEYADGLKARLGKRRLIIHQPTNSILGFSNTAETAGINDFARVVSGYLSRFGKIGSLEVPGDKNRIYISDSSDITLTAYEHEICFLITLGWSLGRVVDFMNMFRPRSEPRTIDTLVKKKNQICHKFYLRSININVLCDYLISIGFHNKVPNSFYNYLIGSRLVNR